MLGTFGYHSGGRAKRVTSVDQVDTAGGDVAVVTLNDSATVRQVRIDGVSCPFFIISSTKIGVVTPSSASATTKTLKLKFSTGATTTSTITYWTPVDGNTTLCMERGDFVGSVWTDRSGNNRHFTDSTAYPPELNKEPQFDGVDRTLTGNTNSVISSVLLGTTTDAGDTYSVTLVFRAKSLSAPGASTYQSDAIVADNGAYIGAHLTTSWLRWYHWLSSEKYVDVGAVSTDEWHVLQVKCDNGSLIARVDGGSWTAPNSVGGLGNLSFYWRLASTTYGDYTDIDVRAVIVDNVARSDTHFDNVLNWARVRHGIKVGSRPEIDIVDSDVFDPVGSDVMRLRGRNLSTLSDVKVGTSSYETTSAIASHALFDGVNDKFDLNVPVSSLLGGSGWTFSALIDCRGLATDAGDGVNQTIFSETQYYTGLEIFRGGARVWQYDSSGSTIYRAVAGGIGNGLHLIQAKWTGTEIRIRVDGGEWVATALASIGGSGNFKIGSNYDASGAFLKGRIVEMFFSDSVLSDSVLDSVVSGVNYKYKRKFGYIAADTYDVTQLSLSAYFKPGDHTSGTWTGTASAGSSSGRNLSESTNQPTVVTSDAVGIKFFDSTPKFDGTNDTLTSAVTFNDLFGASSFSGWVLVNADKIVGTSGATLTYENDTVFGTDTSAWFALTLKSDGTAYIYIFAATTGVAEIPVKLDGGWNLLQWRCDLTNIYFRTNGGDWSSATCDGMHASSLTDALAVGAIPAYSSNEYNGRLAEIALSTTDIGFNGCDDVLAYVNQTYGLSLGGYAPYAFDPTTLSLSLYCRSGDYVAGTWTGTASAGASSGRNLTEGTNYPSVASDEVTFRVPANVANPYALTVINSSGQVSALAEAVEYTNPGTMSGSVAWFRGDFGIVTSNSGSVSNWSDQSSVGDSNRDLAQETVANQPVFIAMSQFNGKMALEFNGTSMFLTSSTWSGDAPYSSPLSYHSVFRHDTLGTSPYIVDQASGGGNRVAWLFAAVAQLYAGTDGTTSWTPALAEKYSAVFNYINSTSSELYPTRDGVAQSGPNPGTNTLASMTVGTRYTHTEGFMDGVIAELAAFNHELTSAERRTLRRYSDSYFGKAIL